MALVGPFVAGESGSIRDLEYVIWEVRFTVLLQARHYRMRVAGLWTVPPSAPVEAQAERLLDQAADMTSQAGYGDATFQA